MVGDLFMWIRGIYALRDADLTRRAAKWSLQEKWAKAEIRMVGWRSLDAL